MQSKCESSTTLRSLLDPNTRKLLRIHKSYETTASRIVVAYFTYCSMLHKMSYDNFFIPDAYSQNFLTFQTTLCCGALLANNYCLVGLAEDIGRICCKHSQQLDKNFQMTMKVLIRDHND